MLSCAKMARLLLSLVLASFAYAQVPDGIYPQVTHSLAVAVNDRTLSAGEALTIAEAQTIPQIGIQSSQIGAAKGQQYILMVIDLNGVSSTNTKRKRANGPTADIPSARNGASLTFGGQSPSAGNPAPAKGSTTIVSPASQPSDAIHADGKGLYLHAMISNYTLSGSTSFSGGGAELLKSSASGPVSWQAPNPSSGAHQYMLLLFVQPDNWAISATLQSSIQSRETFDIRTFIRSSGLALPQWGTYFVINVAGTSESSGATTLTSKPTIAQASTPTAAKTTAVAGLSASQGGYGAGFSTYTTTYSDGGPGTQTYIVANSYDTDGVSAAYYPTPVVQTFTHTTTLPDGGDTKTYFSFITSGGGGPTGSATIPLATSVYAITSTLSNGHASVGKSTSTLYGFFSAYPSGIDFTTGFSGLSTVTSQFKTTYSTTQTLANGAISKGRTTAETIVTRTYSGVSRVHTTTYSTIVVLTTTGYIDGIYGTETITSTGSATATLPALADENAGVKSFGGGEGGRILGATLQIVVIAIVGPILLVWLS